MNISDIELVYAFLLNASNFNGSVDFGDKSEDQDGSVSVWNNIYKGTAGFGLALNIGIILYLSLKLKRKGLFTPGYCLIAMSAADILILSHFLVSPLLATAVGGDAAEGDMGQNWVDSVFLCKVPIFIVHVATGYSAWTLVILSLCSYIAAYRPWLFKRGLTFRRPISLLLVSLLFCLIVQTWIPIFVEMDPAFHFCIESEYLGKDLGSYFLIVDQVINWAVPSVVVMILSVKVVLIPQSRVDYDEERTRNDVQKAVNNLTLMRNSSRPRLFLKGGGGSSTKNNDDGSTSHHPFSRKGSCLNDYSSSVMNQHHHHQIDTVNRTLVKCQQKQKETGAAEPLMLQESSSSSPFYHIQAATSAGEQTTIKHCVVSIMDRKKFNDNNEASRSPSLAASKRRDRRKSYKAKKFRQYLVLAIIKITLNVPLCTVNLINCFMVPPIEYSFRLVADLFPYIYLLYYLQFCFDAVYIAMTIYHPKESKSILSHLLSICTYFRK